MDAIDALVAAPVQGGSAAKVKVAAANSATLLVAARFEEFVRQMAREYARIVVTTAENFDKVPKDIKSTIWKRTLASLAKSAPDKSDDVVTFFAQASMKFSTVLDFCKGDYSRDIYLDLIHNETNMRPNQINELFKISGLSDVCAKCASTNVFMDHYLETEPGRANEKIREDINEFFKRRNDIAHALRPSSATGETIINEDIKLFRAFGVSLCEVLNSKTLVDAA